MFFIKVQVLDIIDITIVAYLMYRFYILIRGTVAINIFITIFSIYLFWLVAKALDMQLLGTIIGQIIGVGVIALIIVFHQEIRRFMLIIGTRYMSRTFSLKNLVFASKGQQQRIQIKEIARACVNLSKAKIGGLIVIERNSALHFYADTGVILNANTSASLIESIFFKNNPLHDGAIIIIGEKIFAARCMLPMSQNVQLPEHLGMRHRAGVSMSEHSDALIIIISEETGNVSIAEFGKLTQNITLKSLLKTLEKEFHGEIKQQNRVEPIKTY